MKNYQFLLLLFISTFFQKVKSQSTEWCGTMKNVQQQIKNNPQLLQQFSDFKDELKHQEYNSERAASTTVYVPVVFHVVHNGDAIGSGENITDAQLISQIDAMNLDYNALDPDLVNVPAAFQNLVANCNIQFCLAKFDPNGNPTTGIIRHQMSQTSWDSSTEIDNILKPATIWDRSRYLNIWSVRMGGSLSSQGILAYSSFPFFGNANADGIVARYNTIGTTGTLITGYKKGKTVSHEAGHWFGLLHVWGDDNGLCSTDANGGTDYITDTPDAADANYGCPSFPHVTCNNGPNGDMFMNYMDYTYDDCRNMFTLGQSARMQFTLNGFRTSIRTASTQCFYSLDGSVAAATFPTDTICSLTFNPVIAIKNEGLTTITAGKFYFQIDGGNVQIFSWSGSIAAQSSAQILLPVQTVSVGAHTLDVTFTNENGQASDNNSNNDSHSSTFYAYDGGTTSSLPFSEDFENVFPAVNWSINNPNNDITWVKNTSAGGFGLSTNSVSIDNLGYGTNPNHKKDGLITAAYDFTSVTYPQLKFDLAYARYDATRYDSLNVYYSLNCGSTWTKLWNQTGSQLATAPDATVSFTPNSSQWKTVSLPLLNLAGLPSVTFKFENVSGWGNALFLDNINLQNNPALTVNEIRQEEIQVFPNPTGNLAAVRLSLQHSFSTMQVVNAVGQTVYETKITDSAIIFSVQNFPSGLYLIHLSGNGKSQTEKLLVGR